MKEILVILAYGTFDRYNLVYAIEKDNWIEKTKKCRNADWRIPLDSVRVSYDRTLSQLIDKNLIEGFYSEDRPKGSGYLGTLWGGRSFRLTENGKTVVREIIDNTLKESERLNQLLLNALFAYS